MTSERRPVCRALDARVLSNVPVAMILILLLAFGLRLYGMTFGAPFEGYYWWDERSAMTNSWAIAADPSPSSVGRGLYPLALSAVYYPLSVLQNHSWNPIAIVSLSLNSRLLIARALSVMAGTLLVGVVYVLGRRLSGCWGGLSASLLTAVSPTLVAESRYATTGMSVTLLVYLAVLPLTDRRISLWKRLLLSFAISALALLTKSNGIAAFAPIPLALLAEAATMQSHHRKRMFTAPRMMVLLGVGLAGLLVTIWLVKPDVLLEYLQRATNYARSARAGASPGIAWQWMFKYEWGILLAGVVGSILGILRRDRLSYVLMTIMFVALYGTAVSLFSTLFVRWLMVILPGLAALAGIAVTHILGRRCRLLHRFAAAGFLIAAVAIGTANAVNLGHNLLHDARIAAWEWAQAQIPVGAKIAMEGHALPIGDPLITRYRVHLIKQAIDQPPRYYEENGFHFVLTADDMYYRWQANPQEHPKKMKNYEALFEEHEEVARFHGTLLHAPPAIDIRVLKIGDNPVYPADQPTLGAGWYEAESNDASETEYRWMTDRGQLLYNRSGKGDETQVLSFDAYVFDDMDDISVYVNGQPEIRLSLDTAETPCHVEIPLHLAEGLSTVELVSEHGCTSPILYEPASFDIRCISIKVGNLKLGAER